jgi:cytochrome P450
MLVMSSHETLKKYDQYDPAQTQEMYETFTYAREKCPVFHSGAGKGFWVVTRYDDAKTVLMNPAIYSSYDGVTLHGEGDIPALPAASDPPEHTEYRNLLQPLLIPSALRKCEPALRELAGVTIETFLSSGRVEIVSQFAAPYAIKALFKALLPLGDKALIGKFAAAADLIVGENSVEGFQRILAAVKEYVVMRRESNKHQNDLFDQLEQATVSGKPLPEELKLSFLMSFFAAGFETNLSTLSLIMLQVAHNPQLESRIQGADWAKRNFQEFLRYLSPVTGLSRTLLQNSEIGGCPMKKGDKVLVHYASVNRDETRFPNADTLMFGRKNANHHMALSFGIHRCLGAPFAELAVGIALDELTQRATNFRLEGDEPLYTAGIVRRPKHVKLLFDRR